MAAAGELYHPREVEIWGFCAQADWLHPCGLTLGWWDPITAQAPLAKLARSHSHPSQIPGRLMSNRQRGAGLCLASSGCFCVFLPAAAPPAVFVQGWGPGGPATLSI